MSNIQAVLNMRDAWKYLLSTIDAPVTLEYLCKLNELIARNEALEWGKLRTGSVGISGTDYLPPVPTREGVADELASILNADTTPNRKSAPGLCPGHQRAILLGREQAHQHDPGQ